MTINELKTPKDIFDFLEENIKYGWLDEDKKVHTDMKDFRKLYRTSSIDEILKYKVGTCVEQVLLMKFLLDKINLPSKMFCCRIFEPNDFNDIEAEERMHCFLLYYHDGKVYQLEHPNPERKGIYEFDDEPSAVSNIQEYYVKRTGGIPRPTDEFFEVETGLTFKEFNNYINSLSENKVKIKK